MESNAISNAPEVQNAAFTTSDGVSIAYSLHPARKAGTPRLALIHSLALDRSIWDGVVWELAGEAEILTYDCRGHGRSERKAGAYSTGLFARDLAELFDHLGWESAVVAGCSMGGCVAQAFAGLYPKRVRALGLIDTTAWYGEEAAVRWQDRANTARTKGLASMVEFQVTRWFGDQFRAEHPELAKAMAGVFTANHVDCFAATCKLLGEADLRPLLASLRMPVAVIVGEEDYATPLAASQYLHQAISGSTLTVLPKARHLTPMECPRQIAEQLRGLLQRA